SLEAKEGLALINGTQLMASLGTLCLLEAERLAVAADVAGAMSLEALKGSSRPFDERLPFLRPHPGQRTVAKNLPALRAERRRAAREPGALDGPDAVPRGGLRLALRLHDRAGHERVARVREQGALPSGERGFDTVVGRQRRSRVDGQREREEAP